jgi:multidrug efflux pump subunit AcrA (membrane-fusion protein)
VKAYIGADTDGETGNLLGEGHLTLIDNQINANTGTIRAKAEFSNAAQKLWPGLLVTVKIQTALDKDALVVPPTVVQRGLDQHFVYRVNGDKVETVRADGVPRQRPGHHQRRQAGRSAGQRRPVAAQARLDRAGPDRAAASGPIGVETMKGHGSVSAWCIDHPVATILLTFALVLLG